MKNKYLHLRKKTSVYFRNICNFKFVEYADPITFVIDIDNIEFPSFCIPLYSALP